MQTYTPHATPIHACSSASLPAHMDMFAVQGDKADHILAVHPSHFELPEGESELKPSAEPAPAPLADTHSASLTMEGKGDMLEAAVQTTPEGQMSKVGLLLLLAQLTCSRFEYCCLLIQ